MPVFAEVVLAVTLCVSGAGGKDACSESVPESWTSANVVQALSDWDECKKKEPAFRSRAGVVNAECRYTRRTGGAV